MLGLFKKKKIEEDFEEDLIYEEEELNYEEDSCDNPEENSQDMEFSAEGLSKEELMQSLSSITSLDSKPARGFIKKKNKYLDELKDIRSQLNYLSISETKTNNLLQNSLMSMVLIGVCGIGTLGYLNHEKSEKEILNIKNSINGLSQVEKIDYSKIKISKGLKDELIEKQGNLLSSVAAKVTKKMNILREDFEKMKKNQTPIISESSSKVQDRLSTIETKIIQFENKFKEYDKLLYVSNLNSKSIKLLNEKIMNTNLSSKNASDKTEYKKILNEFTSVNKLMNLIVTKQKNELINLNKRLKVVETKKVGSTMLVKKPSISKEDSIKIAKLETGLMKNSDVLNNLSKSFDKFLSDYKVDYTKDLTKNVKESVSFQKTPFKLYKILNNATFYISNSSTNELLEQDINVGDVIIDRYEVLNIDKENGFVVFKDYEEKKSIILTEK